MNKFVLLALLLVILRIQAQEITNHFEVIHNGKHLGNLDATKLTDGNTVTYTSQTDIQYHLMIAVTIEYNYHVTYVNGNLKEAKAHITVRGNDKTKVRTVNSGTDYKFYSENVLQKTISETISHSIIQLLFEEPKGITKVYAEEHGEFHNIKKVKDHTYLKTSKSGNKNTYQYEKGVLQKSDVDAGVIRFSIVKKH